MYYLSQLSVRSVRGTNCCSSTQLPARLLSQYCSIPQCSIILEMMTIWCNWCRCLDTDVNLDYEDTETIGNVHMQSASHAASCCHVLHYQCVSSIAYLRHSWNMEGTSIDDVPNPSSTKSSEPGKIKYTPTLKGIDTDICLWLRVWTDIRRRADEHYPMSGNVAVEYEPTLKYQFQWDFGYDPILK